GRMARRVPGAAGAGGGALGRAAAPAGAGARGPALFARGPPLVLDDVMHILSGVAFAACGLVAWRRRPDSAVGRLLTIAGFGILLTPVLNQIDSSVAFTVAALFGELWIALFATLILGFVTGGRLSSTPGADLVA